MRLLEAMWEGAVITVALATFIGVIASLVWFCNTIISHLGAWSFLPLIALLFFFGATLVVYLSES